MVFLTRFLRVNDAYRKWYHGISIYNRYGLYKDDIIDEMFQVEVKEAVRRLPPEVYDKRIFRQITAMQLEITKSYLPKDQWITYEEDQVQGAYLQPYIKEVLAEMKEKDDWEKAYPQ